MIDLSHVGRTPMHPVPYKINEGGYRINHVERVPVEAYIVCSWCGHQMHVVLDDCPSCKRLLAHPMTIPRLTELRLRSMALDGVAEELRCKPEHAVERAEKVMRLHDEIEAKATAAGIDIEAVYERVRRDAAERSG